MLPTHHAQNLDHPVGGEYGVVSPTDLGETKQRDLYAWDILCAQQWSGRRELQAYYRRHLEDSSIGQEFSVFFGSDWYVAHASAGMSWPDAFPRTAAAAGRTTGGSGPCTLWTLNFNTDNTNCTGPEAEIQGTASREATWREDESFDRIFYTDNNDDPAFDEFAVRHMRTYYSDDGFDTFDGGEMEYCESMAPSPMGVCFLTRSWPEPHHWRGP